MPLLIDPGKENTTPDERKWAMLSHATSMLYMLLPFPAPLAELVGPLIIWGWKGRSTEFTRNHAARAVNFNVIMALLHALVIAYDMGLLGVEGGNTARFTVYMVVGFHMLMTIAASVMALDGRYWRYPISLPILK